LLKQLEQRCPGCGSKLVDWGVSFDESVKESMGKPVKNWEEISKDFASRLQKIERELVVKTGAPKTQSVKPETTGVPLPPPPPPVEIAPPPIMTPKPQPVHKETKVPELPLEPPAPPPRKPIPEKPIRADATPGYTRHDRPGRVNGTKQGRVNGTKQGRVNGNERGKVSVGRKFPIAEEEEIAPSRMRAKVGGVLPLWQLILVIVVAMMMISTALIVISKPAGTEGIQIDGHFEDWASVPSYQFAQVIPDVIYGVDEGRMFFDQDVSSSSSLFLYIKVQDSIFTGDRVATVYVFIDTDADSGTGYKASQTLGADLMIILSGWNGSLESRSLARYASTQDQSDWNSWHSSSGLHLAELQDEIEISVDVLLTPPLVQLATSIGDAETIGPIMSTGGTIIVRQTPLISGSVTADASPSVLRVEVIAMGVADESLTFQPLLLNETGHETSVQNFTISSSDWTTRDLDADISAVHTGQGFSFTASGSADNFQGAIDIVGEPSRGYYLSNPARITIDGLFADWTSIKKNDTDAVAQENPNIDIKECGAASQNGSYFMYVGTVGKTFEGADVPEYRKKASHDGGGGGSVVRLRKTGEDLLQAFVDKDPVSGIGKLVTTDSNSIEADYLVEVYGRDGIVTANYVKEWSVVDGKWNTVGSIEKIGVGTNGVEFSVNKTMLGNLSSSEIIFFTTDWAERSDNCWLNAALADPWALRGTGTGVSAFRSNDGIAWANVGSITLSSGETIVAMAHSLDRAYVLAVTNTGRVYDWRVNVDTSWGDEVTGPCNSTTVVGIAPNATTGEARCLIIASNGWTWTTTTLGSARGWTNCTAKVTPGQRNTDFKDVCYNATGGRYWAIRSTSNTNLYYSYGGAWTASSGKTGGGAGTQVHVYHIGNSALASEQIFVLRQDGTIRYSANGGANWAARGNLSTVGGPPPTGSRYVAIDRDSNNVFWAVTNTSYSYKSTDIGATWYFTGSFGVNDVVSLACPAAYIPEFDSLIVPMAGIITVVFMISTSRRMRKKPELLRTSTEDDDDI